MEEAAAGKSQSGANRRMILTRSSRGIMFSMEADKEISPGTQSWTCFPHLVAGIILSGSDADLPGSARCLPASCHGPPTY